MTSSNVRLVSGWAVWLSGVFLLNLGWAGSERDDLDCVESPYFEVVGDSLGVDAFPLKSTEVKSTISGVIADVEVHQIYGNDSRRAIEAVYVFPASSRCAVHGMEMRIGDRVTKAVIQKRAKARALYEQAKSANKNASLLEQERPNVFKMSVANILPGDEVHVTLSYTEYLKPTEGIYEFVYPTVVGPRYAGSADDGGRPAEEWVSNPYLQAGENSPATVALSVALNAGMPLQQVTSNSHDVRVEYKDKTSAVVKVKGEADEVGNRDFILRYQLSGQEIASGLLVHEAKDGDALDENFFLLTVQPPERVRPDQIVPRDYVFVMDVSGSMRGFPLDVSKALLTRLIGSLKPHESFNVLLFAGSSQAFAERSLPANAKNIKRALKFIDRSGRGGTQLLPALKDAFRLPGAKGHARSVVVVTDGFVNIEREAFAYVDQALGEGNLFAFGIGSSVNRHLIEGLAHAGRGEPFIMTSKAEAERKAEQFRQYIEAPVLSKIAFGYQDFEAYDVEPKTHPDVFAKRPLVLYGKWKGKLGGKVQLRGLQGDGRPFLKDFAVDVKAEAERANPALPYLWARKQIERLSDFAVDESNEDAVTELGLAYNLLTEHTSFVAVQEEVREMEGRAKLVRQPLPLPKGVSGGSVGQQPRGSSSIVTTSAAPHTNAVPEPSVALLVLLGAFAVLFQRRR